MRRVSSSVKLELYAIFQPKNINVKEQFMQKKILLYFFAVNDGYLQKLLYKFLYCGKIISDENLLEFSSPFFTKSLYFL